MLNHRTTCLSFSLIVNDLVFESTPDLSSRIHGCRQIALSGLVRYVRNSSVLKKAL